MPVRHVERLAWRTLRQSPGTHRRMVSWSAYRQQFLMSKEESCAGNATSDVVTKANEPMVIYPLRSSGEPSGSNTVRRPMCQPFRDCRLCCPNLAHWQCRQTGGLQPTRQARSHGRALLPNRRPSHPLQSPYQEHQVSTLRASASARTRCSRRIGI